MKKILFGVSDTKECKKAVDCLINLFKGISEFEITLLHVISEVIVYAESGIYDCGNKIEEDIESDDLLKEFENKFMQHKINVKKVVKKGNAADILINFANDYDLLVIGESEQSILHRIFNSHQDLFISASPIPVLIAK